MTIRPAAIAAFVLLATAACEISTLNTAPLDGVAGPRWFEGLRQDGAIYTDPEPQAGRYIEVTSAGFVVTDGQAAYYIKVEKTREPEGTFYIRVQYQNPLNDYEPYESEMIFEPYFNAFTFKSPAGVKGIRYNGLYTATISLYTENDSKSPVETITQKIRAYIDTTGDEVRVISD